eukprot:280347_1
MNRISTAYNAHKAILETKTKSNRSLGKAQNESVYHPILNSKTNPIPHTLHSDLKRNDSNLKHNDYINKPYLLIHQPTPLPMEPATTISSSHIASKQHIITEKEKMNTSVLNINDKIDIDSIAQLMYTMRIPLSKNDYDLEEKTFQHFNKAFIKLLLLLIRIAIHQDPLNK